MVVLMEFISALAIYCIALPHEKKPHGSLMRVGLSCYVGCII